jgi:hypothetical protein
MQEINIEGLQSHLKRQRKSTKIESERRKKNIVIEVLINFTMRSINNASTIYTIIGFPSLCPSSLPSSMFNEIYSLPWLA